MPDFTPRPTIYKGIQMRSRLEAGFAMWLDGCKVAWEYEPGAFASEAGQYLPDFRVENVQYRDAFGPAYIEVKPTAPESLGPPSVPGDFERRLAIIWDSEPTVLVLVAWPNGVARLCPVAKASRETFGPGVLIPHLWMSTHGSGLHVGLELNRTKRPWYGEYWNVQP